MLGDTAFLPECASMVLVRRDTPAYAEREADSSVLMIPITIDDTHYAICLR